MNDKFKKSTIRIFVVTSGLILSLVVIGQLTAERSIANFLNKKIPPHIDLEYKNIDINIVTGKFEFSEVDVSLKSKFDGTVNTNVLAKSLKINGLNFWSFFLNNTINIDDLILDSPKINHSSLPNKSVDTEPQGIVNLLKNITIDNVVLKNGTFDMIRKTNKSPQFSAVNINFNLTGAQINPSIIKRKIPITYDDYIFSADSIFTDLSDYEELTANTVRISEKKAIFDDVWINSKYSKSTLSKVIQQEHDYIDLRIPVFSLREIDYGFEGEQFYFSSGNVIINDPNLTVYRDKLVEDSTTPVPMYSAMLRKLPIDLRIDSLSLNNGKVVYEENHSVDINPGSLTFDQLDLDIYNLNNTNPNGEKAVAEINCKLLGLAPLSLKYNFDIHRRDDAFTLSATLFNLEGDQLNSYLQPSANSQIKGTIDELYFTISGNNTKAEGDVKMKYHDFKYEILKKDGIRVNNFISTVGNLFINDGSNSDADGYRYGTIDAERNPSKSFLNYIWVSAEDGLVSTITGNGKK